METRNWALETWNWRLGTGDWGLGTVLFVYEPGHACHLYFFFYFFDCWSVVKLKSLCGASWAYVGGLPMTYDRKVILEYCGRSSYDL